MKQLPWIIIAALLALLLVQETARRTNENIADSLRVVTDSIQTANEAKQAAHNALSKALADSIQKVRKDLRSKEAKVIAADARADSLDDAINNVSDAIADAFAAVQSQVKARDDVIDLQRQQIMHLSTLVASDSTQIQALSTEIASLRDLNRSLDKLLRTKTTKSNVKVAFLAGAVVGYMLNKLYQSNNLQVN